MWKKFKIKKIITCGVLIVLIFSILGVNTFSASQKKVTIEFFHTTWVPGMLKILEESIKAFEKKYPNIKIKETRVSWTDAPSQLMTSIMGGRAPDIVICNPAMVAYLRDIGALADMTDIIPKSMLQSFLPTALKIVTNQKGRIDGLPQEGCTWQLFYRKDLFEKAGLDPNKPPETWDELVSYGIKLTKDFNNDGVIDQWGFGWPVQAENANDYWVNFMQQAGARVSIYDEKEKRWVSKLLEYEAVKGTQFMVDLVRKYQISPPTLVDMDWEAVTNGFVSGKFAMMYNGAWVVGSIHQKGPEIEGKWGTTFMVAGPSGRASRGYPNTFNILQASTKKRESWQYLYFLYTTKIPNGLTYAEAYCKGADSLLWTQNYIEYAKRTYEPLLQPFIEGTKYSVIPPMDPKWETFKALYVGKIVQQMLMGQKDVQQGLKELHESLEQLHLMK